MSKARPRVRGKINQEKSSQKINLSTVLSICFMVISFIYFPIYTIVIPISFIIFGVVKKIVQSFNKISDPTKNFPEKPGKLAKSLTRDNGNSATISSKMSNKQENLKKSEVELAKYSELVEQAKNGNFADELIDSELFKKFLTNNEITSLKEVINEFENYKRKIGLKEAKLDEIKDSMEKKNLLKSNVKKVLRADAPEESEKATLVEFIEQRINELSEKRVLLSKEIIEKIEKSLVQQKKNIENMKKNILPEEVITLPSNPIGGRINRDNNSVKRQI